MTDCQKQPNPAIPFWCHCIASIPAYVASDGTTTKSGLEYDPTHKNITFNIDLNYILANTESDKALLKKSLVTKPDVSCVITLYNKVSLPVGCIIYKKV